MLFLDPQPKQPALPECSISPISLQYVNALAYTTNASLYLGQP